MCFGFWEVFRILGSVLDSRKCFWILGSVLDSGKCFVPMGHRTIQHDFKNNLNTMIRPGKFIQANFSSAN